MVGIKQVYLNVAHKYSGAFSVQLIVSIEMVQDTASFYCIYLEVFVKKFTMEIGPA
jgi:hypothetical protein